MIFQYVSIVHPLYCATFLLLIVNVATSGCLVGNITRLGPLLSHKSFLHSGNTRRRTINGPSLIHVPSWISNPLGKYYLYFADHSGIHIDIAYANSVEGPYTVLTATDDDVFFSITLHNAAPSCIGHVASPDVHIAEDTKTIILYYHCDCGNRGQYTFRALSKDGLRFHSGRNAIGPFYFRQFSVNGSIYALAKNRKSGSILLKYTEPVQPKSAVEHLGHQYNGSLVHPFGDALGGSYAPVIDILPDSRHTAVQTFISPPPFLAGGGKDSTGSIWERGTSTADGRTDQDSFGARRTERAVVAYSEVGGSPEAIYIAELSINHDASLQQNNPELSSSINYAAAIVVTISKPCLVLKPEEDFEGAAQPLAPSTDGRVEHFVNQLRDPFLFCDENHDTRAGSGTGVGAETEPLGDACCYLLYVYGGEQGIALARLCWNL